MPKIRLYQVEKKLDMPYLTL